MEGTGAGAGSGLSGADGAARRGAGSARRGGRGAGRGALTLTSGNVSDIWPQAASTPIKAPGDASAPSAAACNKRRFPAASRDAPRLHPSAPHMTPTGEFASNSGAFAGCQSHDILPIHIGNIWQCGPRDTRCKPQRMLPFPWISGDLRGTFTGAAISRFDEPPARTPPLWRV